MPKLSILMFAAALVVGLCSAQSGAYAQSDKEAPPAAADQPEAPDQGVQEGTGQSAPDEGAQAPAEQGDSTPADQGDSTEMPPDEDTDQQPNPDE